MEAYAVVTIILALIAVLVWKFGWPKSDKPHKKAPRHTKVTEAPVLIVVTAAEEPKPKVDLVAEPHLAVKKPKAKKSLVRAKPRKLPKPKILK